MRVVSATKFIQKDCQNTGGDSCEYLKHDRSLSSAPSIILSRFRLRPMPNFRSEVLTVQFSPEPIARF